MSLNHKRRIFRSSLRPGRVLSALVPGRGLGLILLGGVMLVPATLWVFGLGSDAPVRPPRPERMVADAARVAVVDGNTLRVAGRVVRLDGVIPPARGETCLAQDGRAFDCGVAAANALAALLRFGPVDCTLFGTDEGGRPVATCSAGGKQLNRAVVAAGWARAEDHTFRAVEQRARAEQRGLWYTAQ